MGQSHQDQEFAPNKHGSYGALLFDKRWKDKRSIILTRDLNQCVICGLTDNLQVHHRQYHYLTALKKFKAPWQYSDKTLITLCNSCHQRGHSKFKVPIIKI
ncbi:hypothetical protein TH53_04320 [Pedobacter lusitanus]|uniref:HNH endonuclease n=1 Tax=Pedobacter lusitanus TaxID=1503925 RepID=A0A0D0GQ80_9SPHI|nr:hypothetical protein TH53_04320 [Pedobacter lusitanus]